MELLRVIVVSTVFLAVMAYRMPRQANEISLDERASSEITCTAKNGETGVCVPFSYCNEDLAILPGGAIHESEFRTLDNSPCPISLVWCCTKELLINIPVISNNNTESCLALQSDIIPWAVSLYKAPDMSQTAESVFCMGSLIGTRVILTAATCIKSAQQLTLYARVPGSPQPRHNYTVQHRIYHPSYNSGSHVFDFGLLVLEEEVSWGSKKGQGACLDFKKPSGECFALGFDSNDEITSTQMKVTPGACSNFGGKTTPEKACGTSEDEVCIVSPGAPVLCESRKGNSVLVGVVRSGCNKDQVLIGGISESSTWLKNELKIIKVTDDVFTEK